MRRCRSSRPCGVPGRSSSSLRVWVCDAASMHRFGLTQYQISRIFPCNYTSPRKSQRSLHARTFGCRLPLWSGDTQYWMDMSFYSSPRLVATHVVSRLCYDRSRYIFAPEFTLAMLSCSQHSARALLHLELHLVRLDPLPRFPGDAEISHRK